MGYFQARRDLEFIQEFANDVGRLWSLENRAAEQLDFGWGILPSEQQAMVRRAAGGMREYQEVRARVARGVHRATRIARQGRVSLFIKSYPAPLVGGPIITANIFDSLLHDPTHMGIERQLVVDALNQAIGGAEERVRTEWKHLVNPVYWIRGILGYLFRLPFMLIELTGFNVSKVEDHFLGKFSKLIFGFVVLYILLRLGFSTEDLRDLLLGIFK